MLGGDPQWWDRQSFALWRKCNRHNRADKLGLLSHWPLSTVGADAGGTGPAPIAQVASFLNDGLAPLQQIGQLSDIAGNPSRVILAE